MCNYRLGKIGIGHLSSHAQCDIGSKCAVIGNWCPKKDRHSGQDEKDRQGQDNLQFLEIAVRNIVGAPVRHRIELNAM